MAFSRCAVDWPPPEIASAPSFRAPSQPDQKPIKGPNENAKKIRSAGVTPAASRTVFQHPAHHCQESSVSSQYIGLPVVPEVWCTLIYRSTGNVSTVPKGGWVA